MAKEISFSAGDFVVYPTHGVGKVMSITKDTVAGQELELIAVRFDKDRMTLRCNRLDYKDSGGGSVSGIRRVSLPYKMNTFCPTDKGLFSP